MKEINLKKLIITVFIISWIGVLPGLLISHGVEIPGVLGGFEIFMTLGPILGAFFFIYKANGRQGLKSFFGRLFRFKAAISIILFALLFPILLSLVSSVIGMNISQNAWPEEFTVSNIILNGLIVSCVYLFINTEELVWRGIVFEKLLQSYSFIKSCLIIIPIWWLFHMPLFLFAGGHQAGYGLLEFTFIVIAQSFVLGWIYVKTNRSLFYIHAHHQLLNGFGQAFPIFPVFIGGNKYPIWTFCFILILTTIWIFWSMRNNNRGIS